MRIPVACTVSRWPPQQFPRAAGGQSRDHVGAAGEYRVQPRFDAMVAEPGGDMRGHRGFAEPFRRSVRSAVSGVDAGDGDEVAEQRDDVSLERSGAVRHSDQTFQGRGRSLLGAYSWSLSVFINGVGSDDGEGIAMPMLARV